MRTLFPGSYHLREEDFKALWSDGVVVFDANMLLNFHRYSDDTRREFLDLVSAPGIAQRIWIPHQVAVEYHRHLPDVRHEQVQACYEMKRAVQHWGDSLKAGDHRARMLVLLRTVDDLIADAEAKYSHPERTALVEQIAALFEGKVGPAWTDEQLRRVYKEGEDRYARKLPPGFKDASSKKGDERFGDLVIWLQIIEEAKKSHKPILFVTDDLKEDWWLRVSGKTVGPLPALTDEIWRTAAVQFYMYSGDRFLEQARKSLRRNVRDETVAEVKQVRVEHERHSDGEPRDDLALMTLEALRDQFRQRQSAAYRELLAEALAAREEPPRSRIDRLMADAFGAIIRRGGPEMARVALEVLRDHPSYAEALEPLAARWPWIDTPDLQSLIKELKTEASRKEM